MKKYIASSALLVSMLFSGAALADQVSATDIAQIIQARVKEHQAGKIGDYKQVWGTSNPLIDNLIKQSAAVNGSTFVDSITSAKKENSFASTTSTCVDDMVMNDNGAYYNTIRNCTTTRGDRTYMHNSIYPALGATMMASVYNPAVEIGTFPPNYTFMTFYGSGGYASEFLMIRNGTQ